MCKIIRGLISNPSFQVLLVGVLGGVFYADISELSVRFFFTVSVLLREVLLFVLPFLIFSFVSVALSEIGMTVAIFLVMFLVCLSSFFHTFLGGVLGYSLLSDFVGASETLKGSIEIMPLIDFDFVKVADNISSLIAGVFVGILNSYLKNRYISQFIYGIHDLVIGFMNKFFVKLLPLFVCGFFLKLLKEGQFANIICVNASVFLKLAIFLTAYFCILLFIASKFNWRISMSILKNIAPALIVAFATVSSATAFPLSLRAATINTGDKRMANTIMPLTLSFHLAGDALLVMVMCMMVAVGFNHVLPDFHSFAVLAVFFVFNQFAGAGIPNATIMVLIPILKSNLNFDDSMCAFTIAFYSIIEPISTVGNVALNNFFIILFKNIFYRFWNKCDRKSTSRSILRI